MRLERDGTFFELEHDAKVVRCRHGAMGAVGEVTQHEHRSVANAKLDAERLLARKKSQGFVELAEPLGQGVELIRGSVVWKVDVEGTRISVVLDGRETVRHASSAEMAQSRACELAEEQRKRGFVGRAEAELAKRDTPKWSRLAAPVGWGFSVGAASPRGAVFVQQGTRRGAACAVVGYRGGELLPLLKTPWTIKQVVAMDGGWLALGSGCALIFDDNASNVVVERFSTRHEIRGGRRIADAVYAVGMGGTILRRDDDGIWSAFTEGLEPDAPGELTGFEDIDGPSADELYVVGWGGAVYRFDGTSWRAIPRLTEHILTCVCHGDGQIYAAGQTGIILEGRGDDWRVLLPDRPIRDIWDMAWCGGHLYVLTLRAVYRVEQGRFLLMETSSTEHHHLCTDGQTLWSLGQGGLESYDGEEWSHRS